MKKRVIILIICVFVLLLLGLGVKLVSQPKENPSPSASATNTVAPSSEAGQEATAKPTATPNEKIRYTEGRVLDTEKPSVEGPVASLSEEEISVNIAGKAYVFQLGENGKRDIGYFNQNQEQPRIIEGTIIVVNYENVGKDKVVTSLEIVESN